MEDVRLIYVNPRDLLPSARNVRSNPGDLAGLAETIREHGVLQPLGVRPEDGAYRIVYGNRRRDAAIVVGLDRVPCIVLGPLDEEGMVVSQVLENMQRLDLNDLDKSRAFEGLLEHLIDEGRTQTEALDEMARTLGLSSRQIQRYLRLRELSPFVQRLIAQGELGVTHAQHLVGIGTARRQEDVATLAVEESLSAAELSRLVAALEHNANIEPRLALEMLRRGERIAVVESRPREPLPQFGPTPIHDASADAPWDDDDEEEGKKSGPGRRSDEDGAARTPPQQDRSFGGDYGDLEPVTRDGNRVRKIHSLDAFMDELQRLTRCLQDGDFQGFQTSDGARVKTRLAARQLRFLADAVAAIAAAGDSGDVGPDNVYP
jgi:ParB family transcriptional regulator, chromosome partitioning protein